MVNLQLHSRACMRVIGTASGKNSARAQTVAQSAFASTRSSNVTTKAAHAQQQRLQLPPLQRQLLRLLMGQEARSEMKVGEESLAKEVSQ